MSIPANYTLQDVVGAALGCILFVPVLLAPGYVIAWFTRVLGFRGLTSPWKLLVSLPLSVAICPIATYWAGLAGYLSAPGGLWLPVFALYGSFFLIWLSLLAGAWGHDRFPRWLSGFRRVPRAGWIIPAVWLLLAIASLAGLQVHDRLYLSFTDLDHEVRTAIVGAIGRDGVRPFNPFYFLNSPAPLRYHYFWFLLCYVVTRMGGTHVSSEQSVIASVVWCGWSLIALVPLYLRFFQERSGTALRRYSLVAIALFAVTGLDIVPTALRAALGGLTSPEMEWWNEQVTSWVGSLLWVPHHVAALVIGLMGFLLIWDGGESGSRRRRIAAGILAGAAFAGGAGTSIYVTLVFAVFVAAWMCVALFRRWRQFTAVSVTTGVVAILMAAPYLWSLAESAGGSSAGGSFVKLTVREFLPLSNITQSMGLDFASRVVLRLLALPLNYFLELGFFGVAAVVFLSGLRRLPALRSGTLAAVTMAIVSVGICTFLRSRVVESNDLGWRGFLPAQFIMLLWGADLIIRRGERAEAQGRGFHSWWLRSPLWAPLIVLGVAGTLYELVLLRTYFLWSDAGTTTTSVFAPDRAFGVRALDLRRAYETLDRTLPAGAKLQSSPEMRYFDFYNGLYSNRQTVVGDRNCGALLGGSVTNCRHAYADVSAIFDGASNETWGGVTAICRWWSIDALIVTDLDAAWKNNLSWVWQAAPVIAERHVRVYLTAKASARP